MTYVINPSRFSSGGSFSPSDIASLVIWLDAANRGSTTNQWDDLSGNGNHFTAASAGEFPTFSGGIATFDAASSQHLDGPDLSALTEGEIFIRIKKNADPSGGGTASGIWAFGTNSQNDHVPFTDGNVYCGFGSTGRKSMGNPTPDLAAWRTWNIYSASNDYAMLIDGSAFYSTVTNTVGFSSAPILGKSVGDYYLDGDIKQMCIFNAKLSTADRASMVSYMNAL